METLSQVSYSPVFSSYHISLQGREESDLLLRIWNSLDRHGLAPMSLLGRTRTCNGFPLVP